MEESSALSTLETLASYVPGLVARYLATDPTPITEPIAETFEAAVLFADIAGFTYLAEQLAKRGPVGAEELTRLLNIYFGQLIDLVTSHGGDIVKFAGDALLAVWPINDQERLDIVTRRATQCGLAAQRLLHGYEITHYSLGTDSAVTEDKVQLSLRIGIGAGETLVAYLGGVRQRWEFLVAGAPIVHMSRAQQLAQPGQVVLSPEAWQQAQNHCTGYPLSQGYMRIDTVRDPLPPRPFSSPLLVAGMEEALRAYIPYAVHSRIEAGQTGWLAELRPVTIVFLNLPDLDYTISQAQAQKVMRTLQTAVYRYEGSINKLSVDDKGVTLIAALGLPPLAHEDDAARGVQAAITMRTGLQEMGVRSAIGVTSGRAFCGLVGTDKRREYTLVGNVVNLGVRLMQAAPNDILCDEATHQAARTRIAFDPLSPIIVKGRVEPVAVFRPRGKVLEQMAHEKATIIGRIKERALLTERLDALLYDKKGGVAVIEGEAGIGKSRLVEDLLYLARAMNVTCLVGTGDAIEKMTPYHAWRPIFRQMFDLDSLEEPGVVPTVEAQRQHVLAQLASIPLLGEPDPQAGEDAQGPGLSNLIPLLNAVLPIDLPENELTAQMIGQVRADNTHTLLLHLLQTMASRAPTLLILEDAHWMDSASWALSYRVSRQVPSALLVVATRPPTGLAPIEYRQLLQAPDTLQILLGTLPPEDALALACHRLGVTSLPQPVAKLIREKAEGHPFFSEELAYALRDAGLILIENGECRIAPDSVDLRVLDFPDTIQGVITSRIDRLSPAQQLVLKVASVIGRVFSFRALRDIHPIEADRLHLTDYLDALEKLDITPLETPEPDLAYIFKHIITREVAYNLLLFAHRQELHRAVATWYERTHGEDLAPFYPLLAHHWGQTESVSKTIDYLEKASEQALRSFANQEAIEFLNQTMALDARQKTASDRLRRGCWERQLGQAYWGLGQVEESHEHFQKAAELLGWPMPARRGEFVLSLLGMALRQLWRQIRPARPALLPPEKGTALLEAVRTYEHLAEIYYHASKRAQIIYSALRTLNLAELVGPSLELTQAYANMCIIAGLVPLHALANGYARRAREISEETDLIAAKGYALQRVSIYYTGVGQWETAQRSLEQAIIMSERLGNHRAREEGMTLLSWVIYYRSEFANSQVIFAQTYQAAYRSGNTIYQARGLSGQATNALRLGQLEKAIALVGKLQGLLAEEEVDRTEELRFYALSAVLHLYQGNSRFALQEAGQALSHIVSSAPTSAYILEALAGVAEVYLTLWETSGGSVETDQELESLAQQACAALHQFARRFPIGEPRASLYQGWANWLAGRTKQAAKMWKKSLQAAEKLSMPYEHGLALYEIGRHLDPQDPARETCLTRACAILEQLGAAFDLARAQQAMSATVVLGQR